MMGDITYNLKHEHRVIERALRALDGMSAKIEAGDTVPHQSIAELFEFLSTFGDRYHHGKEEKYLFPALLREGVAPRGGATDVLEREHDMERKLISELGRAVDSYSEGNAGSRASFARRISLRSNPTRRRPYGRALPEGRSGPVQACQ